MKTFPDINALVMYVALVQMKSFKDAAKECGVTPSSVSQAVRTLEEQYQVELIDRSVRPIGVTLQGRNFFKSALTIVENAKALKQSVLIGSDFYPSLRLGVSESVSATIIPWLLPQLRKKVQNITVTTAMTHRLSEGFLQDNFDIFIGPVSFPDVDNIYRRQVLSEKFLLIAPQQHGDLPKEKRELIAFANTLPYLTYNPSSWDNQLTARFLRTLGLEASRTLQAESSSTLLGLIAQGQGWTLMPATNLFMGLAFADSVAIRSLADVNLVRQQYVLTQSEGFRPLVDQIAHDYAEIIQTQILSQLKRIHPTLAQSVSLVK